MGHDDDTATVADIERTVVESSVRAQERASRRRTLAVVVGAAALGALAASALTPTLGGDEPARGTDAAPARSAPARPAAPTRRPARRAPSTRSAPAPRAHAEEPSPGEPERGTITIPRRVPRPSLPPP